ncbi:MAG: hypothetical protein CM15mV42_0410 [uncultured marine virus]|nr:MAG: hypothetical protein CM15mV42_0410 [uncultured marine virus]
MGIITKFDGVPPFENGVNLIYYPITSDDSGLTAAAILQGLGSYVAQMINPNEYGVKTAVDVSGYLMQGLVPSATNPYQGARTQGGLTVQPLYENSVLMFLDQGTDGLSIADYLDTIEAGTDTGEFKDKMIAAFKGSDGLCPSGDPQPGTEYVKIERCDNPEVRLDIENVNGLNINQAVRIGDICWKVIQIVDSGERVTYATFDDCEACALVIKEEEAAKAAQTEEEAAAAAEAEAAALKRLLKRKNLRTILNMNYKN